MPTCPICGSRWNTDDPFCPNCSPPPEEQEVSPDAEESPDDEEMVEAGRDSGPSRRNSTPPPGRDSGPSRRNSTPPPARNSEPPPERDSGGERDSGPRYGAAMVEGGAKLQESGVHAVAKRRSVPPPRPEPQPAQEAPVEDETAAGASYGSAVLAQGEIEEEIFIPDEASDEDEGRADAENDPGEARAQSAAASNGSQAARASSDPGAETPAPEKSRDSVPPKKAADEGLPPPRPPVLASEALRKEAAPLEPGRATIRVLLVMLGLAGAGSALLLMRLSGMGVPIAGVFIGLTLLGLPPIPYAARAVAAVTISACALGVVTWMNIAHSGSQTVIAETVGLTILASALFFRAWHRGSTLARVLVVVGLAVSASWLGMSGVLSKMTTLDPQWQSWMPIVLRAPLGLLLMLSLLAFMDERSTGGCEIWATGVVLWQGVSNGVHLLARFWPPSLPAPDWSLVGGSESVPMITSPLLATLVAFGTAQLLAVSAATEVSAGDEDEDEDES